MDNQIMQKDLPLGPVNVDLLQQVKQHILDHPEQFSMCGWIYKGSECGTIACVAGWAYILHQRNTNQTPTLPEEWEESAINEVAALLGLATKNRFKRLFYTNYWHEDWRRRWWLSNTREEVQIAAEYIDYICGIEPPGVCTEPDSCYIVE